ncbi:MAG: hypothetical protein RI988_2506 [Pseudomonadota bacterium]|jgi:uncharacterized protein involved in exopolysaccharide biosynthesis
MSPADPSTLPEPSVAEERPGVSVLDLLIALAERIRLLAFGSLGVGVVALGIAFVVPPVFTSRTVIVPPQQQQSSAAMALQSLGALAGAAGAAAGVRNSADQYVALLQSHTVQDSLIERFELRKVYDVEFKMQARQALIENSRISAGRRDNFITIEVEDEDPQRATDLANAYVEELRKLTARLALTEAQQRRQFFEGQLQATRERMSASQKALMASGYSEGSIRAEPRASAEAFAKLRAEATAVEVRLQALRSYLSDNAPEVKIAASQLAALRGQLARSEAGSAQGQANYIDAYREFKYQETLFELLSRQFEVARLDESREGGLLQVVDPAKRPEKKSKPRRAVIAVMATLVAFLLLAGWVMGRVVVSSMRRDAEVAEKLERLGTALRLRPSAPVRARQTRP